MADAPRISLVLEQTLGHRTHTQSLERVLGNDRPAHTVDRLEYTRVAGVPWAVRASFRAARVVRSRAPAGVTFFHTQSVALFAPMATRGAPYVVSIDATPAQIDAMGGWYRHRQSARWTESAKRAWYHAIFSRAHAIVAWSQWAADSLASDYGVRNVPIEIAHPGAPDTFFSIRRAASSGQRPTILFVGGDFERKGGPSLLRAFKQLGSRANLVLVTEADVAVPEDVRVIRGITAGSEEHRRVFERADLFCLPTLGDCTPLVIGEAMAAGLPVVTTRIGSNEESVGSDAGVLVPPADDDALAEALDQLVASPARLREMGDAARARASELMHADRNARRVLAVLNEIAERTK